MFTVRDLIDILRHLSRYLPVAVSGDGGNTKNDIIDVDVSDDGDVVIYFDPDEEV